MSCEGAGCKHPVRVSFRGRDGGKMAGQCPATLSSPACCEFLLCQSCVHAQLVSTSFHVWVVTWLQTCRLSGRSAMWNLYSIHIQHTKSCRDLIVLVAGLSVLNGVAVFTCIGQVQVGMSSAKILLVIICSHVIFQQPHKLQYWRPA